MKFLFICVALCGALAAQTTTRPESAPTSRPLTVLVHEATRLNAYKTAYVGAVNTRLERVQALTKQFREAYGDALKDRIREELQRIKEEQARDTGAEAEAELIRVAGELLAYGIEDVRSWYLANGTPIPDLPDWRYVDVGSVDVTSEQLGDWIGFRANLATYSYVGPWDRMPVAVRIDWKGIDAFGDQEPGSGYTSNATLGPIVPSKPVVLFAVVVSGAKTEQATERLAKPAPSTVRVVPVRGRSAAK